MIIGNISIYCVEDTSHQLVTFRGEQSAIVSLQSIQPNAYTKTHTNFYFATFAENIVSQLVEKINAPKQTSSIYDKYTLMIHFHTTSILSSLEQTKAFADETILNKILDFNSNEKYYETTKDIITAHGAYLQRETQRASDIYSKLIKSILKDKKETYEYSARFFALYFYYLTANLTFNTLRSKMKKMYSLLASEAANLEKGALSKETKIVCLLQG